MFHDIEPKFHSSKTSAVLCLSRAIKDSNGRDNSYQICLIKTDGLIVCCYYIQSSSGILPSNLP